VGVVVIAILIFLGLRAVRGGFAARQEQVNTGDIVEAFVGDLSARASATGRVTAAREADLALGVSGRVEEVRVQVGDQVQAGDVLVSLEDDALARNVATAEQNLVIQEANLAELQAGATAAEIAAAEAQLASAQVQLDDLLAGPTEEEIASAQANIDAAQANVWSASAQVGQASTGVSEVEIAAARQQVTAAQAAYDVAKEAHDRTLECFEGPNEEEVCPLLGPTEENARRQRDQAAADLATAQAQLDALLAGPDQNVVSGAQAGVSAAVANQEAAEAQLELLLRGSGAAQIAAAEATVAQAQASLDSLITGATAERIAIAEAQVEQARIQLAEAQETLANASLTAPFDGVVTEVFVVKGETAGGVAVRLVDANNLTVVLDVDEVDVGEMAVGQPAVITLESWPDLEFESEITAIAPSATTNTGSALVTYEVHLSLQETDLPVRIGMTANASLITSERENVLLIPNAAINVDRSSGTYSVNLVQTDAEGNETTTEVEVTIGLRDNTHTQITSGLQEGDRVMIGNAAPVEDVFGGGPGGGPFGGGDGD
jgi:HlyD family secretion protein